MNQAHPRKNNFHFLTGGKTKCPVVLSTETTTPCLTNSSPAKEKLDSQLLPLSQRYSRPLTHTTSLPTPAGSVKFEA